MGTALKNTAMGLFRVLATSRTDQPKQVCRYEMGGHRLDWYRSEGKAILRVTVAAEATGNL